MLLATQLRHSSRERGLSRQPSPLHAQGTGAGGWGWGCVSVPAACCVHGRVTKVTKTQAAPSQAGSRVCLGNAQRGHVPLQQLTCVISPDFRISRKTQKEAVSLLQRKGNPISTSCDPVTRPHISGWRAGRWASIPWTLSPFHGSRSPPRCSGPEVTGPVLSRGPLLACGAPHSLGTFHKPTQVSSDWSFHGSDKHPPPDW